MAADYDKKFLVTLHESIMQSWPAAGQDANQEGSHRIVLLDEIKAKITNPLLNVCSLPCQSVTWDKYYIFAFTDCQFYVYIETFSDNLQNLQNV